MKGFGYSLGVGLSGNQWSGASLIDGKYANPVLVAAR
jgi:hypothetical protein